MLEKFRANVLNIHKWQQMTKQSTAPSNLLISNMDVEQLFRNLRQKEAECPVNDPKTLPCLHSFCLLCLDKHAL